jgi:hypothetical protein
MQLDLLQIPNTDAAHAQLNEIARLVKESRPSSTRSLQYHDGYRAAMRKIERVLEDAAPETLPVIETDAAGVLYAPTVGFRIERDAEAIARDIREAASDMAEAFAESFPTFDYTISVRRQAFGEIIVVTHSPRLNPEDVSDALKHASRSRPFILEVA